MSGADFLCADAPVNPYYSSNIDVEKAKIEHTRIKRAFEEAGISLQMLNLYNSIIFSSVS